MQEEKIYEQVSSALNELIKAGNLGAGSMVVIGCSSSEICGKTIGMGGSLEAARAVFNAADDVLVKNGIYLAAQCCEHLNRALVIERCAVDRSEIVCAVPKMHAGGSFATVAYENMKDPVLVETVRADAGIDIGGTLIGMHLKRVAVPVRLSVKCVGDAVLLAAYTRPKLIGGERAEYK